MMNLKKESAMKKLIIIMSLILCLCLASTVFAAGLAFEQITVAATAIGGTSTHTTGAVWMSCRVRTAEVCFRCDGTAPTSSVCTVLNVGDIWESVIGPEIVNFKAIRTGGTSGQLDCHYR